VDCNRRVKFTQLLERARLLGLGQVATGHYARVGRDPRSGRWLLRRAADPAKDQSYVLYGLTQEELSRTIFPLGELSKPAVRRLAAARGLGNAAKPDSQDICFAPRGGYADFLAAAGAAAGPGDLVDGSGRVLGRHGGVHRFTIGQRHGLGLFAGRRLYVTAIEPRSGVVTVGPEADLYADGATLADLNLVAVEALSGPMEVEAMIRYRQVPFAAVVEPDGDGRARLLFREPQKSVAPGQAAVLYQGDLVVGGGTIESALRGRPGPSQGP
jgi:tRNA-specific 2-thiouridylase